MSIEQIVTNIDARIVALQSEIQPLLDAKVALLNGSPAPKVPKTKKVKPVKNRAAVTAELAAMAEPPSPVANRRPRRSTPRAKVDPVPAGKLIALLGASDGLTATALAKEAGGGANQVRVLLKALAEAGQVRRTGERRATRWHLITDEEKIAARAAEIEAQRKTPPTRTATAPPTRSRRRSPARRS